MKRADQELYERFSEVLTYPGDDYPNRIGRCRRALRDAGAEARDAFREFADSVTGRTTHELEELFTRTFDLNPACALEVGWHLFGENYERGRFLVRMRQELVRAGLAESEELPDHLTQVLRVLPRMAPERAAGFVAEGVLPAMDKMIDALEGRKNPYESLLRTLRTVLAAGVPTEEAAHA